MSKLTSIALLVSALALAGCATTSTQEPSKPSTPAAPSAQRTPVTIPAVSAKKVVMSMTGPKQVTEAKDWPDFKKEWSSTFGDHAKAAGIDFSLVEGNIPAQNIDGTAIAVNVADYRMVGIGARIFLGVMTGNAYIDAKINFANLRNGSNFGDQQHNTSSSAWGGIFAKVTPQQVDAIATEVFKDLKLAK